MIGECEHCGELDDLERVYTIGKELCRDCIQELTLTGELS